MAKSDFKELVPTTPTRPPYTPATHASVSLLKPTKVISTSTTGEHGPCAVIEFEGGFSRTVDLPTHKDANHILFDVLDWADKGRLRDAAALVVPIGDGTVKVYRSGFSFTSTLRSKRGAWVADNDFDVPAQDHEAGYLTGYKVARELLAAMKIGGGMCDSYSVHNIITAAAAATGEPLKCGVPSRRGAAHGFMKVIEGALRGAARFTDFDGFIDRLESDHIATANRLDAHYAERKDQRIAKSIATRKARAAERKAAAEPRV